MMVYGVGLPPYKLDMVVVGYRCYTHSGIAFSEHHLAVNKTVQSIYYDLHLSMTFRVIPRTLNN